MHIHILIYMDKFIKKSLCTYNYQFESKLFGALEIRRHQNVYTL